MAVPSLKSLLSRAGLVSPDQFEAWRREWLAEPEGETRAPNLLSHLQRRSELPEPVFLARLGAALGWPFLERVPLPQDEDAKRELRRRLSPKVAFAHHITPVKVEEEHLWLATANPFDPDLVNAVLFEAGDRVQFALAPRDEVDKGLKGIYLSLIHI